MEIKVGNIINNNQRNKIIVIHEDGTFDVISSPKDQESYYHINYFKKYLDSMYLDDLDLQRYKDISTQPTTVIYLLLKNHNDIIFADTTRDEEENMYGMFYLPDSISEDQLDAYKGLKRIYFSHYKEVVVCSEMYLNDYQIVESKVYEHVVAPDFSKLEEHMHVGRQR